LQCCDHDNDCRYIKAPFLTNNGFFGALSNHQTPRQIDNYGDNSKIIITANDIVTILKFSWILKRNKDIFVQFTVWYTIKKSLREVLTIIGQKVKKKLKESEFTKGGVG